MDKYEIETLSKVIENSIVFTLSKSGKFSQFDNTKGGKVSNAQKRKRKFMIGMSKEVHAHQYQESQSCESHEGILTSQGDAKKTSEQIERMNKELQEIDLHHDKLEHEHTLATGTQQTDQSAKSKAEGKQTA